MTSDRLAGERPPPVVSGPSGLPVAVILSLCDRILHEVGRRGHLFSWLRAPGGAPGEWLPVDCYYPAHRLVVSCQPDGALLREVIPLHRLRLLEVPPAELGEDPASAELALREMIDALGPSPRYVPPPPNAPRERREPIDQTVARALASLAQPSPAPSRHPRAAGARSAATVRGARFVADNGLAAQPSADPGWGPGSAARHAEVDTPAGGRGRANGRAGWDRWTAPSRVPTRRTLSGRNPPTDRPRQGHAQSRPVTARSGQRPVTTRSGQRERVARSGQRARTAEPRGGGVVGIELGLLLIVVLLVEVYLDVAVVAFGAGQVLLAFGIALDAAARVLGTIAAGRAKSQVWAWACSIGGTPAVAAFAFFRSSGPASVEPAALAGLLSLCASVALVFGALVWWAGG